MLYRKVERTIEQYLKSGSNRILYNIFKKGCGFLEFHILVV